MSRASLKAAYQLAAVLMATFMLAPPAARLLAEDATGSENGLRFRRVFVPRAELESLADDHMPLIRERFEELITQLNEAAEEPPALATPVSLACYYARVEGGQLAEGRALWRIDQREPEASLLALGEVDLPIGSPRWRGPPPAAARVGWSPDTGLVLLVPAAGDLLFRWSRAGSIPGEGFVQFDLRMLPAGRTTLIIDAPAELVLKAREGGAALVSLLSPAGIEDGAGDENESEAEDPLVLVEPPPLREGWSRWRIEVADATALSLALAPASPQDPSTLVLLDQFSVCRIAESGVELRTELRLDVQHQPLERVIIELDPRLALTAAQMGETTLQWYRVSSAAAGPEPEGSTLPQNLVAIDLPEPITDRVRSIQIAAIAPLVTDQPWTIPTIRPLGMFWQQGLVEIQVEGNLELTSLSPGLSQQIETSPGAGTLAAERHELRCSGPEDIISAVITRRQSSALGEMASRVLLGTTTIRGTSVAALAVEYGEVFDVLAAVPPAWIIDEVESVPAEALDYWSTQQQPSGGQELLIRLRHPLRAGPPVLLVLRGVRRTPAERPFALSELRMVELLDVKTTREDLYLGADAPWQPVLSGHSLPIETVSQPADLTVEDHLGVAAGDLSLDWTDFTDSLESPQVDLKADPVRFRCDISATVRVQDDLLLEQYTFACSPETTAVSNLLVQFSQSRQTAPSWSLTGENEGALVARKLSPQQQESRRTGLAGEVWDVQLPRPRKAPFRLQASRSLPRDSSVEIALAVLPEASTQNGEVRVLRETAQEFAVVADSRLPRIPLAPAVEFPRQVAAFRYRPERDAVAVPYSLLSVSDTESSQTHLAWIRTLRLETLAFDGQLAEHRVLCEIENYGARQLAFRLPGGMQLGELLVDGKPLPDAVGHTRGGETTLALPARERMVSVEFRLTGSSQHALGRQSVPAPLPQFEMPVLDATWTLWCPPGREVLGLRGPRRQESLAEPGWRKRLFGPLARAETSLDGRVDRGEAATARTQVEWLLKDMQATAAESSSLALFWSDLARRLQTAPPGEPATGRLPVLVDRATLDAASEKGHSLAGEPILKSLGLAVIIHPQALILTDNRCDWLSRQCLRGAGRQSVWEISCDGQLARVGQALRGSTRFVPIAQWSAEFNAQATAPLPVASGGSLAPAGWTARHFELPTGPQSGRSSAAATHALLYRPARVQWLGWLGLLFLAPTFSLLCGRFPSAALVAVAVLGVAALLVPPWLVPVTSLALLGALVGLVLRLTTRAPRLLPGAEGSHPPNSGTSSALRAPMTTALLLVGAGLVALALSAAAQGQATTADPPDGGRTASIIFPLDEEGLSGHYVYVPKWFYHELHRRAGWLERQPRGWLLRSASYEASPAEQSEESAMQTVQIRAAYQIEVLEADTRVVLPLPFHLLAEGEHAVLLDGRPVGASGVELGEGVAIEVTNLGTHRIELELRLPVTDGPDSRLVELAVPPVSEALFHWKGPPEHSLPQVPTALGAVLRRGAGRLESQMGPTSTLQLRWPPKAERDAAHLQAEQLLWLKVRPGSMVVDGRWKIRTGTAPLTRLRLWVDRRLQMLPLPENGPIASANAREEAGREVVLEFKEPVTGEFTLDLSFLVRNASGVGNLRLPRLDLHEAGAVVRAVAISLDPTIAYVGHEGSHLEPLAVADFATRWGGSVAPPQMAFELGAGGDSWSLATRRREPVTAGTAQVELYCGAQEIDITYQAQLSTSSGALFQHRLELPDGLEVDEVTVTQGSRNRVARWTRDESGTLTAFLAGPVSGEHEFLLQGKLPVTVFGEQELPSLGLLTAELTDSTLQVFRREDADVRIVDAVGFEPAPNLAAAQPSAGRPVGAFRAAMGSGQLLADISPNEPNVTAVSNLLLEPGDDGHWMVRWQCELNVQEGQLDALRLLVPPAWVDSIETSLPCRLFWSDTASPESKLLTVYPQQAFSGSVPLELIHRPARPVEAPQLTLLEVDSWLSRILLPSENGGQPLSWETQNLLAVDLPDSLAETLENPQAWTCYEILARPYQAEIRMATVPLGVPHVRLADIYLWWQEEGEGRGVVRFDLQPAGHLSCRVQVPEGCQVVDARVEDAPVNLIAAGENLWKLELTSKQLPQRVELVFQVQLANATGREWELIAPTLTETKVERTLWTVVGPYDPGQAENPASLQRQQIVRIESLSAILESSEQTMVSLPGDDTANWYSLWARRLAVAQRELLLAPPLPAPLGQEDQRRLSEIDDLQAALADRLEIGLLRSTAVRQAAAAPPEIPGWISLGRQLRPPQRYVFSGDQGSLRLGIERPQTMLHVYRRLSLAVWILLSAALWSLRHSPSLHAAIARWPGLLVVLAGLGWWLWLSPAWLGVAIVLVGLLVAFRGERPAVGRRRSWAT